MANLFESPAWESGIYQLETTDRALAGPDGILNVPFKQLANRTQALRKRLQQLRLNVLDFGASPQLGFDNTQAFTDAFTAAQAEGGGTVYAPPGRYELQGALLLPDGVVLQGAGAGRTQLVLQDAGSAEAHIQAAGSFSPLAVIVSEAALPGQQHLRVTGTLPVEAEGPWLLAGADNGSFSGEQVLPGEFVEPAPLTASLQLGSMLVTGFSHGVVLRPGDAVLAPGFLPAGTTVVSASGDEVVLSEPALQTGVRVRLAVPGLLTLTRPLRAAYTQGLAELHALTPVQVGLEGLGLLPLNDKPAFSLLLGRDCFLEDLALEGSLAGRVRLGLCQGLQVQGLRAQDSEPQLTGTALLTVQGCEGVLFKKLELRTARTGLSLLPWDGGATLLNHHVRVEDSQLMALGTQPVVETGANTDGFVLAQSTCTGTLRLGGRDLVVQGCRLSQHQPDTSIVVLEALRPGLVRLEDTVLEGHPAAGGANQSLVHGPASGLVGLAGPLAVELERVACSFNGFLGTGLFLHAAAGGRAVTFLMRDCKFEAEAQSTAGRQRVGMRLLGQSDAGFAQVRLEGNRFAGVNVLLDRLQASHVELVRNEVLDAPGDGISLLASGVYHPAQAEQQVYLRHNRVLRADRTGVLLVGDGDGSRTRCWVKDNELLDANQRAGAVGSASSSLAASVMSELVVSQNLLGSRQPVAQQEHGFAIQSVQVLHEHENVLVGALTNMTMGVAQRLSRYTHNGELKEAYRTTAPSTGSWKAGDRVWNSNPTNRNNLGWVCIGSGTPGIWVPIGSSQSSVQVKLHGPFVMTAGQTVLTLPEAYQTNRRLLQVFRSGLALSQGNDPAGTDFDWVVESSTSIRFRKPCLQDEVVEVIEFQIGEDDSAVVAPAQLVQTQEIPTGDVNSTDGFDGNGVFTVSHVIATDPLPVIKISGIAELRYGIDYTVDGSTITLLPGAKPIAPEWLVVTYYHAAA